MALLMVDEPEAALVIDKDGAPPKKRALVTVKLPVQTSVLDNEAAVERINTAINCGFEPSNTALNCGDLLIFKSPIQ